MRLRAYGLPAGLLLAALGVWLLTPWAEIGQWALTAQRGFQDAMANALLAIRSGDPLALASLCTATAAYGIVHAIGPGHGKVLLGGAALASGATFRRLAALTLLSSLAQAGMAILVVAILVFGWRLGAENATALTEQWLAPLSAAAIALIGAAFLWRGLRAFRNTQANSPHESSCGCGHAHGPSTEAVQSLRSFRDAAALVVSIAIRPCTGALFVLIIAARFDAFAAGCLAVLAMGLGTAATNLAVAGGGYVTRRLAFVGQGDGFLQAQRLSAALNVVGGGFVLGLSLLILLPDLSG